MAAPRRMFLVLLAVLLLGTNNVGPISRDLVKRKGTVLRRCHVDRQDLLDQNAQSHRKFSTMQREGSQNPPVCLERLSYLDLTPWSKELKTLSKSSTSIARRFFKFCRWVKHYEDVNEARSQSGIMKLFLWVRIGANFGADWAEEDL